MKDKGYQIKTLEFFGVGYNRETKNPVFPIANESNYIIGWQERNLRYPKKQPKYLFSSQMDKKNTLYNYYMAKQSSECVVVEAILSVMALHEIGIPGISPLNASLSRTQAAKLGVFKSVTFCFDGDIAGKVALAQAVYGRHHRGRFIPPLLKGAPFEVYSVTPPTKIHRMRREDIRPMLQTRQRILL
jgi:DNA primase